LNRRNQSLHTVSDGADLPQTIDQFYSFSNQNNVKHGGNIQDVVFS